MRPDYYLEFPVADLLLHPEQVRDALLTACRRLAPARLGAVCQIDESFLVVCREAAPIETPTSEVQIDTLDNADPQLFRALLQERWQGGYMPMGTVCDNNGQGAPRSFLFTQK